MRTNLNLCTTEENNIIALGNDNEYWLKSIEIRWSELTDKLTLSDNYNSDSKLVDKSDRVMMTICSFVLLFVLLLTLHLLQSSASDPEDSPSVNLNLKAEIKADGNNEVETYEAKADCGRRDGETYILCPQQKLDFLEKGLGILEGLLTEEEILTIESTYDSFMRDGSPELQGKNSLFNQAFVT